MPHPGAGAALVLLLLINLFNYMDRQVLAAVVRPIKESFFGSDGTITGAGETLTAVMMWCQQRLGFKPEDALVGLLGTAFMVVYIIGAPVFARLAERTSRWVLIGIGVLLWSLASGASGMASTFLALLLTRCLVGVGEAAWGPIAPTLISDLYPVQQRGRVLAWFYMAIPVGSALGYVLGGWVAGSGIGEWGARAFGANPESWRWAFYLLMPPGILLGLWSLFMSRAAARAGGPYPRARRRGALARLPGVPAHSLLCVLHARHDGDDLLHRRHRVLDALLPGNAPRCACGIDVLLRSDHRVRRTERYAARGAHRRPAARPLRRLVFPGLGHRHARGLSGLSRCVCKHRFHGSGS